MGIGPAPAIRAVLERCGLSLADIDLFEINEGPRRPDPGPCARELGLDLNKLNERRRHCPRPSAGRHRRTPDADRRGVNCSGGWAMPWSRPASVVGKAWPRCWKNTAR